MAIALTLTKGAGNTPGSVSTLSITSFTVSVASSVIYVGAFSNTVTVPSSPTCTWDIAGANEAFTEIAENTPFDDDPWAIVFRLTNPTPGTNKTITVTGLPTGATDAAIAALFTGVDQTTPNDSVNEVFSNAVTSLQSSTVVCPAGDVIASFCAIAANNMGSTFQQGGSPDFAQNTGNNSATISFDTDTDGADDTMDWSWSTSTAVTIFSFNINADAGGAAPQMFTRFQARTDGLGYGGIFPGNRVLQRLDYKL